MGRAALARLVLVVVLVVLVVLEVMGGRLERVDNRLLPPPDGRPHLLPAPDGLEHGLDDPVRGSGRRLPDRVCSS